MRKFFYLTKPCVSKCKEEGPPGIWCMSCGHAPSCCNCEPRTFQIGELASEAEHAAKDERQPLLSQAIVELLKQLTPEQQQEVYAEVNKPATVPPQAGGCWYCFTVTEPLLFSSEFDTNVHRACLEKAAAKDPKDREAAIMVRELLDSHETLSQPN